MGKNASQRRRIDKAIKSGFGFPRRGSRLLEFIDWGGGDILHYASPISQPARLQRPLHRSRDHRRTGGRKIGLSTRTGCSTTRTWHVDAYREQRLAAFVDLLKHFGLARPPVV